VKLHWDEQDDGVWAAFSTPTECGVVFELVDWQDGTRLSLVAGDATAIVLAETDTPDVDRLKALAERINAALIEFHAEGGAK
jgi:hypothetical protein